MPTLHWDKTEFIECLEVLPEEDPYETRVAFQVRRGGLLLELTVWPCDGVVAVALGGDAAAAPAISFCLVVTGTIELKKEQQGEFLLFRNCAVSPSVFYYNDLQVDPFDARAFRAGVDVRISVNPDIRIAFPRP